MLVDDDDDVQRECIKSSNFLQKSVLAVCLTFRFHPFLDWLAHFR